MSEIIQYKCKDCNKTFFLLEEEVDHSEKAAVYITCPYFGKHKNIIVTGKYENLRELNKIMTDKDIYKRKNGRMIKIDKKLKNDF